MIKPHATAVSWQVQFSFDDIPSIHYLLPFIPPLRPPSDGMVYEAQDPNDPMASGVFDPALQIFPRVLDDPDAMAALIRAWNIMSFSKAEKREPTVLKTRFRALLLRLWPVFATTNETPGGGGHQFSTAQNGGLAAREDPRWRSKLPHDMPMWAVSLDVMARNNRRHRLEEQLIR